MFYFLSLGSNQGDREAHMQAACREIETRCGHIVRRSADYHSAPWGYQSDHEYLNIVIALTTPLSPPELLRETQAIERALGRTLKSRQHRDEKPVYQDRPIDIDLLEAYDHDPRDGNAREYRTDTDSLTLPHPLMGERPFVQQPLSEIR